MSERETLIAARDRNHKVAALYVQSGGIYYSLADVDPWDEASNDLGSALTHEGEDGGCFAAALAAVRRFGGVLEHPAYSHACLFAGWPY